MLAAPETTAGEPRPEPRVELAPGGQIAKYRLRRIVGAGAMGVVWAAYDPDLDREVAIKLLHGDPDAASRTRLLREGRAMARLKHPNVLTVHEVGTEDNRDFVVMELVDGGSLDGWLATHPQRADVFAALLAAGRGLAAAHAAGLVHRDFKPHNVLRSNDGRVLVTDFGLARERQVAVEPSGSPPSSSTLESSGLDDTQAASKPAQPAVGVDSVLGSPLTGTGLLIGTPAYMPPEQLAGGQSDATSDQYAFCVTAWQALAGQRPFAGKDLDELRAAAIAGPARLKANLVPAVRAVLERGLDPDPKKRWRDMPSLLARLERARHRRTVVMTSALALVILLAAAGGVYAFARPTDETCTGASAQLRAVWNDPIKSQAHAAFVATNLPYAQFAWDHAAGAFDRYGSAWVAMHTATCRATQRKEQSPDVMDLRMTCLGQRLQELGAAAELWTHADRHAVARSAKVTAGLSPLAGCADVAALQAVLPPQDAATEHQVADVRGELARIRIQDRTSAALAEARKAVEHARATGYDPVIAEALLVLGPLQDDSDHAAFEQTMKEAFLTAEACNHVHVATGAAAELAMSIKDGPWWARITKAVSKRRPGDARDRAEALYAEGEVLVTQANYDAALASLRESLAIREQDHDDLDLGRAHTAIGEVLRAQSKFAESSVELRRAIEEDERTLGPNHSEVADALDQLSSVLAQNGDPAEALAVERRALSIREQIFGPDSPRVGESHLMLAVNLDTQGDHQGALVEFHRALAIDEHARSASPTSVANIHAGIGTSLLQLDRFDEALVELRVGADSIEREVGPEHPELGRIYNMIGTALAAQGKTTDALVALRRSLAIYLKAFGPNNIRVASARRQIGDTLARDGKFAEALLELEPALAVKEQALGPDHIDTGNALASIGQVHLELHRYHEAVDELGRAVAIFEAHPRDQNKVAELQFSLARAIWGDRGGDHARAISLARTARDGYAKLSGASEDRRDVEAWLAAHPR